MVFQQKLFEKAFFIVKMTGPAIVRPCSSDLWKASALRSKTQLCKKKKKKFKDKRATTLWLNHIMTCDLTHGKSNLFFNSLQIIRVPGKH